MPSRSLPATPAASSTAVRRVMQGNRSRDTAPELAVRRLLHAQGLRYRVDVQPLSTLRRRADVVFSRARVAVFVDGCFWHGCRAHAKVPVANNLYWSAKLSGNIARDIDTNLRLHEAGWTVLRFWEHEDPATVVAAIAAAVRANGVAVPTRPA